MELKLGKLPARIDSRTIKLSSIMRRELLPPLPDTYHIDEALGGLEDNFMYANNRYGCCVISARAHQTLRFEKFEQGIQLPITDDEVIAEYFHESGGADNGLYMLNSLKSWRKKGWRIGDKVYKIYAFAAIDWKNHDDVKHCIHLLGGVNLGMRVYQHDFDDFVANRPWDLNGNPSGEYIGGHAIYACAYGYDEADIEIMTWGKRQAMSWGFWDRRVDEAYGIVDNKNYWMAEDSPVDIEKLDAYLKLISMENWSESNCPIAKAYADIGNYISKLLRRKTRFKAIIGGQNG